MEVESALLVARLAAVSVVLAEVPAGLLAEADKANTESISAISFLGLIRRSAEA